MDTANLIGYVNIKARPATLPRSEKRCLVRVSSYKANLVSKIANGLEIKIKKLEHKFYLDGSCPTEPEEDDFGTAKHLAPRGSYGPPGAGFPVIFIIWRQLRL